MLIHLLLATLIPCSAAASPGSPPIGALQGLFLGPSQGPSQGQSQTAETQEAQAQEIGLEAARKAATQACDWLVAQQNKDGSWTPSGVDGPAKVAEAAKTDLDDDEFWKRALGDESAPKPKPQATVETSGDPLHAIGVTGLATLALIHDGSTMARGRHEATILKAVSYLLSQQDPETGLIGQPIGSAFHYDHAIATFALARLNLLDRPPALDKKVQLATNYIARARNPYGVWRYDFPPNGDNDSSITAWMTLAIGEAAKSGIKIDVETFPSVIEWFNQMTEEGTGRVGYTERGSVSSRVPGKNETFATKPETLTAAGLVSRLACGQTARKNPVLVSHVRCILQGLPDGKDGQLSDALWLYYGTAALREIGSRPWEIWSKAMIPLALAAQRGDDAGEPLRGSFDPKTVAWGFSTGRVGTTALAAAALHIASE